MLGARQPSSLLVVGLFCLIASVQADSKPATLDAVCHDEQVSLKSISAARKLIEERRTAANEACNKFQDSFEQLEDILVAAQTGKVCDLAFVDKIRDYHLAFIVSDDQVHGAIPKALRHFFYSLCFQISADCKMSLIQNLEQDTKQQLDDEVYDEILFLEAHGATFLEPGVEISDFDDLLILNDVRQAFGVEDEAEGEEAVAASGGTLLIKIKTNKMMRKLIENCNYKFKPFYDKLIMPVLKLSNLGYNYQGDLVEREIRELKNNEHVRLWYNIVQTCEAIRTIKIYEDPEMANLSDGRQALSLVSGEEAEKLQERGVETVEEELAEQGKLKPIVYEPVSSMAGTDELWITNQAELEKLVQRYKANASEAERVRIRLLKKLASKMKALFMSGKVFMLARDFFMPKTQTTASISSANANEEFITMLDQAVEEEELASGGTEDHVRDGSVAGRKKIPHRIVKKHGPAVQAKQFGYPQRIKHVIRRSDGTKTSTKMLDFGKKFLPKRMNIFMWFLAIIGFLLVCIGAIAAG